MSHEDEKPVEGSNYAESQSLEVSVIKASMPAAIARWEQKIAHMGEPRLAKDPARHKQQLYCHGYVDAVYDMLIGQIQVESKASGDAVPEPVKPRKIVLLGDR